MLKLFSGCYRIASADATLWLVAGAIRRNKRLIMLPDRLASCAEEAGWNLRESITWDKLTTANSGTSRNSCSFFRRQKTLDSTRLISDPPYPTQSGGADIRNDIRQTERCRQTFGAFRSRHKDPGLGPGPIFALFLKSSRTECFR